MIITCYLFELTRLFYRIVAFLVYQLPQIDI